MVSIGCHVYVCWCKRIVRTVYGNSNSFQVKVSVHKGTALSPLLFVIVMEALLKYSQLPYQGSCHMQMTWL